MFPGKLRVHSRGHLRVAEEVGLERCWDGGGRGRGAPRAVWAAEFGRQPGAEISLDSVKGNEANLTARTNTPCLDYGELRFHV